MKIGSRLTIGFGLVIAAMLVIAALSVVMLTRLPQQWTQMSAAIAQRNEIMLKFSAHLSGAALHFKNYTLRGGADADKFMAEMDAMDRLVEDYRGAGRIGGDEKALLDNMNTYTRRYRDDLRAVEKKRAGKADLSALDHAAQGEADALAGAIDSLVELAGKRAVVDTREMNSLIGTGRNWLLLATMVGMLLALVIALSLRRSIAGPLAESVRLADQVAAGDLSVSFGMARNDETGQLMQALRRMNESLSRIVGRVRASALSITGTAAQLVAGHEDMSRRTDSQTSALQQAASDMRQFTASVKLNADNARKADKLAQEAMSSAAQGSHVVSQVVGNMDAINVSSKKVADITGVIDTIAFQTNILALNAAVEAARAGEQGRGFAVVASEVRNLAQRSAQAAKEIKVLIGDSAEQVKQGTLLAGQVSQNMSTIVAQVRQVNTLIADISETSKGQGNDVEQVNQNVTELERMTQQNAALVQQTSTATAALEEQARLLEQAMALFRLADAAAPTPQTEAPRLARPAGRWLPHRS